MDQTADLFSETGSGLNFSFNQTNVNISSIRTALLPPLWDRVITILAIISLLITMISMGCTMEVSKIKKHILKPKGVAIAVLSQYGLMPFTAFCLAKIFHMDKMMAVVILICGCCPGGTISNILALGMKGDMNLSIVMTSCSTLLALGMMPLMLYIYCQGFSNLQEAIPYIDIIISLVLILVPCGSGILINHFRPQYSKIIIRAGLTIMAISMIAVNIIAITHMGGVILVMLSSSLIAIGALMPLIGYTLGYVISSLFKLNHAERRTVSMETGCQNIQLCVTILKLAFPPAVAGPLFMFPIIYLSFQLIEAVMLMILLRCYQKFTKKDKETYQPAATGDKLKELS